MRHFGFGLWIDLKLSVGGDSIRSMYPNGASDRETITAAYDELDDALAKVAALSYDVLTHSELVALESRREVLARRNSAIDLPIINRLAAEADPKALGGTSLADMLAVGLRISQGGASAHPPRRVVRTAHGDDR